jgi:peptide-methionine (S)-S-oxide reductase
MNRRHRPLVLPLLLLALAMAGCGARSGESSAVAADAAAQARGDKSGVRAPAPGEAVATFAGGCFWCMEPPFEKLDGVRAVISGYMGGSETNPTYDDVGSGRTGHTESVQIIYDPKVISYERLLEVFWHNIDPTTADRQFCDRGRQYRPAIFWQDSAQRALAQASLERVNETKAFTQPIVVEVTQATPFYPAEDYHQDFYRKDPVRYYSYRAGCGRDARLKALWGEQAGH